MITGAGQGIGRAIALKFAKEGTSVIVNNVTEDKAKSVSKEIEEMGGSATSIQADVAHQDEVTNMVSKVMDEFGKIDILVNNAGIQTSSPFLKMSIAEWDRIIDVNLKGTFLCSQLVANNMIKNNYGKIVNIASIHYIIPRLNRIHYDVSKAGIAIMTKEMALELAKYK